MRADQETLAGRVAFITGANRGIGSAIARVYARAGADVIVHGRDADAVDREVMAIVAEEGKATALVADLGDQQAVARLPAEIERRFGRLDILVASAALIGPAAPLAAITPDEWRSFLDVNLHSLLWLLHGLDPLLRRAAAARVIVFSSGAAHQTRLSIPAYALSKAAIEAAVRLYAAENADGTIRANILNPGPTRTAMRAAFMPDEDPNSLPPPEAIAELALALACPEMTATGEIFNYREWAAERR
jgi:NAD(P)-dependent dehydrogenase (short-subunit alcohol dehydrogenase family)